MYMYMYTHTHFGSFWIFVQKDLVVAVTSLGYLLRMYCVELQEPDTERLLGA